MNKNELIKRVAEKLDDVPRKQAARAVEAVFESIAEGLQAVFEGLIGIVELSGLVGVVAHDAKREESHEPLYLGGQGFLEAVQVGVFVLIGFEDVFPIVSPPHLVKDAGGTDGIASCPSHTRDPAYNRGTRIPNPTGS